MNTPPRPRVNAQDRGLDDIAETERPWSSVTRDQTEDGAPQTDSGRTEGGLRVSVEYVVVDGEDAEALSCRQAAAIREVLRWSYARSTTTADPGQT